MDQSQLTFHDGTIVVGPKNVRVEDLELRGSKLMAPEESFQTVTERAPVMVPKAETAVHTYKLLMNIKSRTKKSNDKEEEEDVPEKKSVSDDDSADSEPDSDDSDLDGSESEAPVNSDDDS